MVRDAVAAAMTDDADANARRMRHDVRDRLAVLSCTAGEIRLAVDTPDGASIDDLLEWAGAIERSVEAIGELVVTVRKLPKQPPPPPVPPASTG